MHHHRITKVLTNISSLTVPKYYSVDFGWHRSQHDGVVVHLRFSFAYLTSTKDTGSKHSIAPPNRFLRVASCGLQTADAAVTAGRSPLSPVAPPLLEKNNVKFKGINNRTKITDVATWVLWSMQG